MKNPGGKGEQALGGESPRTGQQASTEAWLPAQPLPSAFRAPATRQESRLGAVCKDTPFSLPGAPAHP